MIRQRSRTASALLLTCLVLLGAVNSANFVSGTTESLGPFRPLDDAYVRSDQASTNFNSAILYVDKTTGGGGRSDILLKFQITGINGRVVVGAILRLFVGANSDDGSSYGGDFFTT